MKQSPRRKSMSDKENLNLPKTGSDGMVFGRDNYKWLLAGLGILVAGFLLLIGGGSDDPNEFSYALFDFQRLTLAPILLMAGYMIGMYAIMKKPSE